MNLVDSSGWLEFFIDGKNADQFKKPLDNTDNLIIPTICIYEVFKVVLRERGQDSALQAIALMKQGQVVDLSSEITTRAANISHNKNIPMADSIILATAENNQAIIWTQDIDFKDQQNVKYFPK
jgi:predicted nucleic acid-binding protein